MAAVNHGEAPAADNGDSSQGHRSPTRLASHCRSDWSVTAQSLTPDPAAPAAPRAACTHVQQGLLPQLRQLRVPRVLTSSRVSSRSSGSSACGVYSRPVRSPPAAPACTHIQQGLLPQLRRRERQRRLQRRRRRAERRDVRRLREGHVVGRARRACRHTETRTQLVTRQDGGVVTRQRPPDSERTVRVGWRAVIQRDG